MKLSFFNSLNNNINTYNWIQQKQQQQLYPIFNNQKSILLSKPQTPTIKRRTGRSKKNTPALDL